MRTALPVMFGLSLLALAPARARADPPQVSMRLDYLRGAGGETCPVKPTVLRREVARRMGYDPFEQTDPAPRERLAVVVENKGDGFSARIERFDAAGVSASRATFPTKPQPGPCAVLMSLLAPELRARLIAFQAESAEPAQPEPRAGQAAPELPELRAEPAAGPRLPSPAPLAPAEPAKPPEPPSLPNPARRIAKGVIIGAGAATAVFLGLGIGWSVYERNQRNNVQTLSSQAHHIDGGSGCYAGGNVSAAACTTLQRAWQSDDAAGTLRNGWFAAAGVTAAVGVAATVWALNLPATVQGQPQTQVLLRPGGLVFSGTF
jgi:hypothetical protein